MKLIIMTYETFKKLSRPAVKYNLVVLVMTCKSKMPKCSIISQNKFNVPTYIQDHINNKLYTHNSFINF